MADVHECTVLMANLTEYDAFNSVYAKYFTTEPPARAAYQVVRVSSCLAFQMKYDMVRIFLYVVFACVNGGVG